MAGFGRFTDHAPPTEGLLEVQRQLRQLRTVVLQVLLAQQRGETVPLDSPAVLALLELPEGTTAEAAAARLHRAQAAVQEVFKCPHCASAIRRLEGVDDTTCPWCGQTLSSEG